MEPGPFQIRSLERSRLKAGTSHPRNPILPPLKYRNQPLHRFQVRDRAAYHGSTGSGDGANDVGPPGAILGGFSFCAAIDLAAASAGPSPPVPRPSDLAVIGAA